VADILSIAYLTTAAASALASLRCPSLRTAGWWLVLAIGVELVGLLRAAEAALWIDGYVQHRMRAAGWYDYRRPLQLVCILLFAGCLLLLFRRLPFTGKNRPLAFGTGSFICLLMFAFIRFSSLHWADSLLGEHLGSTTFSHSAQFILLTVILIAGSLPPTRRKLG